MGNRRHCGGFSHCRAAGDRGRQGVVEAMERLAQKKGMIFDLDGTLLDSMWIWDEVDRRFLAKRGIALPPDYMEAVNALEFSQAAAYTISRFALEDSPAALIREWTELSRQAYACEIRLKPGAKAYLARLRQNGIRLGVATSSARELFVPALKNNGIYDCFTAFATTKEAGKGKDFPDVYCLAARRLGLGPSECAVFEDTLTGLKGAAAGGFLTVGVYDAFSTAAQAAVMQASNLYIKDFLELI